MLLNTIGSVDKNDGGNELTVSEIHMSSNLVKQLSALMPDQEDPGVARGYIRNSSGRGSAKLKQGKQSLESLSRALGVRPKNIEYDDDNNIIGLDLSYSSITMVPNKVFMLTKLIKIDLSGNLLSSLPDIFSLLSQLQSISLNHNEFEEFPKVLTTLPRLSDISLSDNSVSSIIPSIGRLRKLESLDISHNNISSLPDELGDLASLIYLNISDNTISSFPESLANLSCLSFIDAVRNRITEIPVNFIKLKNLKTLLLGGNLIGELPESLFQMESLSILSLSQNVLDNIPPQISLSQNLEELELDGNNLTTLPSEMGDLLSLIRLDLNDNQLVHLPPELSLLENLKQLLLGSNPALMSPPPEIVKHGTEAVLVYLNQLLQDNLLRFEAKLLLVGEGGTGKSSLLRNLRDEEFDPSLSTTHGIEVNRLAMLHPTKEGREIALNTWDFGGQQIYQATHQFFLTHRSLYIVVWNARLGAEQGRLNHWLNTIQALAPDASVLLVATHTDERPSDLNFAAYKQAYPQIVANFDVSNRTGSGFDNLRESIRFWAAKLPLMGQPWPRTWVNAEQALLMLQVNHLTAAEYLAFCKDAKVDEDVASDEFGQYMHDLGKILYFQDDDILSDLVVLKPNWVTNAIARVLDDRAIESAKGILSHSDLSRIWVTDDEGVRYPRHFYRAFLRLMERFDLSYQIEADDLDGNASRSLIPQLLPHQQPANLPKPLLEPGPNEMRLEMVYRLNFVPSGIMSWFIVRTHKYTQNLHWREGVVLKYKNHQARVELNVPLREVRLLAWGSQPHNFFTILMGTIDLILERFDGLKVEREVPCICHWQRADSQPCPRSYRYEDMVRRMEKGRFEVECPDSFETVSVQTLLFGIHVSTDRQVIKAISESQQRLEKKVDTGLEMLTDQQDVLNSLQQNCELIARNFARQWNYEMSRLEAECPNTFVLLPPFNSNVFNPKNWIGQEYRLQLLCQHPSAPHLTDQYYIVRQNEEWWIRIEPWLNEITSFLKYAIPVVGAFNEATDAQGYEKMKGHINLLNEVTKATQVLSALKSDAPKPSGDYTTGYTAHGPALRALYKFLIDADPSRAWGDLEKTVTPEGNTFWLCSEHRKIYQSKPLAMDSVNSE